MSELATTGRDLATLEDVIERGMTTFVDVGTALAEIRDGRLYRETHTDFDSYCRQRWGFSRQRALQMIDAAGIATALTTIVVTHPTHESQVRELARIEPERRAETWQAVVEQHGPTPTAANVRAVVESQRWTPVPFGPTSEPIDLVTDERTDRLVARVLDTEDMADGRLRVQLFRELKHLSELVQLKPDAAGSVIERDELPLIRAQIADARRWLDDLEKAIEPRGLRVVG